MPIQDNDLFLIDDGGTPKKVTAANLLANCEGSYADKFLLINDNSDNSYKMKASNLKTKLAESTTRWMMVERGGVSYKAQNTTLAEYFASVSYWTSVMGGNVRTESDGVEGTSIDDGYHYSFGRSRSLVSSSSYSRPFIIKQDMDGQIIWKKYFNTGNEYYGGFYAGKVTGGYIYAVGESPSSIGNSDPWLVKLDTDGNIVWQMSYGESGSTQNNRWYGIDVDSSGNIYTTGRYKQSGASYSQAILAKWNSSGTLQWQRRFTSPSNIYTSGYSVAVDTSGNPYMVGNGYCTTSTSNTIAGFIIKYNSSGTYQWGKYYENADNDGYRDIVIDSYNRIFVCGIWQRDGYAKNGLILRYTTSGSLTWRRSLVASINGGYDNGGFSRSLDLRGITSDNSGNIYVGGHSALDTTSPEGSNYIVVAKLTYDGNLTWKRQFHYTDWSGTGVTDMQDTGDGVIVTGEANFDPGNDRESYRYHLPSDALSVGTYGPLTVVDDSTVLWGTSVPGAHGSLNSYDMDTPPFTTASASHNIYNISSADWDHALSTIEV